jgi:hypothetical protein
MQGFYLLETVSGSEKRRDRVITGAARTSKSARSGVENQPKEDRLFRQTKRKDTVDLRDSGHPWRMRAKSHRRLNWNPKQTGPPGTRGEKTPQLHLSAVIHPQKFRESSEF